jgi:hypothetical protein
MKKSVIFILTGIVSLVAGCSDDTSDGNQSFTLTQQEKNDLLFLREEEKLARDVYLFSFDAYGDLIFNNIAASEQQHMDEIMHLLDKYDLDDPASPERGVFKNEVLQGLYNDLTAQSQISLMKALTVGATIEDLDISDIATFETRTTNPIILNAYELLTCGSRNHLRSFTERLLLIGIDYVPQYISAEEYTSIISSDKERCGQ